MKLKKTLAPMIILPAIAASFLAGCGGDNGVVTLKGDQAAQFGDTKLTQAPVGTVLYPDDRPSEDDGKALYQAQNCASCHGADGSSIAPGAKAALSDPLWAGKKRPVEEFIFLTYGDKNIKGHEKPLRDTLSRREIWNLVAYSRALAAPLLTKEEMDAVLPVFGANCAVCHGTKGDGDGPLMRNLEPAPANFQVFARFYDRDDDTLYDHIANGIRWEGMPNFLGKKDPRNKVEFDQKYIRKLVAYVRAFHFSTAPTLTANSKPSTVGGTDSLPPTPPTGSDLGHKDQTQPEQSKTPASAGQHEVPSSPAESASPSSGSATGTEPINSPSSPSGTAKPSTGTTNPQH